MVATINPHQVVIPVHKHFHPHAVPGRPQAPTKLLVREVGAGLVEVTVQLIFPGSERLNYNLTVLLVEGGRNTVVSVETGVIQNYMNGESWPITIPNLMVGGTYRFMMAMANEFGPAVGPVPSADFTVAGQWVGTWAELAQHI